MSTLNWKTHDTQPTGEDLPLVVLTYGGILHAWNTMAPTVCKREKWASIKPETQDPLHEYGHLKAIREAVIAATNGESADHARQLFNETFLKGVEK